MGRSFLPVAQRWYRYNRRWRRPSVGVVYDRREFVVRSCRHDWAPFLRKADDRTAAQPSAAFVGHGSLRLRRQAPSNAVIPGFDFPNESQIKKGREVVQIRGRPLGATVGFDGPADLGEIFSRAHVLGHFSQGYEQPTDQRDQ